MQSRDARSGFGIRPVTEDDLPDLLDLYEGVAAEGKYIAGEAPIDRDLRFERWRATLSDPAQRLHLAESDDGYIGMGGVHIEHGIGDVGMLVRVDWRGRGVGSALLEACIDWARAAGAHKLTLQVWPHNTAAISLYEKFGFEREGLLRRHWRRRSGELWDAVVMGLLLE